MAQEMVDDLLTHPQSKVRIVGEGSEMKIQIGGPMGRMLVYDAGGTLKYFGNW